MAMTLRAARVNLGMTQKDAADIIGVKQETLGKWEKGITSPKIPQIKKIEQLYHVPFGDLIFLPSASETTNQI